MTGANYFLEHRGVKILIDCGLFQGSKYAKEFNVKGVLLYTLRFCDSVELDVPVLSKYLKDAGLRVLHIEDDYSMRALGQLRTRIQAFLEMIG